jgi:chromosome segregation ATPase
MRIDDLQQDNDILRDKVNELIAEKDRVVDDVDIVKKENQELFTQIEDLQRTITNKENYINTKEIEIVDLKNTIANLESTIHQKDQRITEVIGERDLLSLLIEEEKEKCNMLQFELKHEKQQRARIQQRVEGLEKGCDSGSVLQAAIVPLTTTSVEQSAQPEEASPNDNMESTRKGNETDVPATVLGSPARATLGSSARVTSNEPTG